MQFAVNLKFLMDQAGMTNYQLAKKLDCHQSNVAYWLSGERVPRKKMQLEIANLFGVSQEALMDGGVVTYLGKQILEEPLLKPETIDYLANKKSSTPEGMELTETQSAAIDLVMQLSDAQLNKFIKLAELLLEESAK